jgi:ABC-type multidrug transport system fused ATPase/permease subunit
MLPTVTRTCEVVLRLVPDGLREASLAMGAPEWRTTWGVILPTARTGIITAMILGVARVVGETAPLIMTAFGSATLNANPFSGPQAALSLSSFQLFGSSQTADVERAWVFAFVLLAIVLISSSPLASRASGDEADHGDRTEALTAMVQTRDRLDEALGDASAPATLSAHDVHAWFGDHHVLGGISLEMQANSITALIGPSGCGKSTFLRIMNRMHELVPEASLAGAIELNDRDIYGSDVRATDVRRRIGMVFQKPNPFPAMTVAGNVLSGLKLCGMKTEDPDGVVEHCLERAGLWNEVKSRLDHPAERSPAASSSDSASPFARCGTPSPADG